MGRELYGGVLRAFYGPTLFSAAQVEASASKSAPVIPTTGSGTPYLWAQIFTKGKTKYTIDRPSSELGTDQTGPEEYIGESFSSMLEIPIADINLDNLINLVQVGMGDGPVASDTTIHGYSTQGLNYTDYAKPILLYRKSFDPTNNTDTPKIGVGADTKALLLYAGNPPENFGIFGGDNQEIITGQFKATAVDGTTVLGITYVLIDLVQTTAEA